MNKDQYFEFSQEFFDQCLEISKKKNSDYTGGDEDPFANFKSIESLINIPNITEIGFITRMNDKMKRISSFVEQGTLEVKDESVADTLNDLANYCSLFAGYLKSKSLLNNNREINLEELEAASPISSKDAPFFGTLEVDTNFITPKLNEFDINEYFILLEQTAWVEFISGDTPYSREQLEEFIEEDRLKVRIK